MKVVIAGGTGFLGQPLAQALAAEGREVVVLTRGAKDSERSRSTETRAIRAYGSSPGIPNIEGGAWTAEVEGAAVVNLAGESIGARRWSAAQKQRIVESRVQATRSLARAIRGASADCGRLHQRIRGRILRAARRRSRARGPRRGIGLSGARLRAMGI